MGHRRSLQDYQPAEKVQSSPFNFNLSYNGAGLTAATNTIAQWTVPAALMPSRKGNALRLAHINVDLEADGTGATGGSWTFTVTNSAGTVLGTASIAYNADPATASVDLRGNGEGPAVTPGDTLSLNLTAVPTGVLSGGLTSALVGVTAGAFGIEV